ncbi:hypothetical protein jhhlp_002315 [Lomentospora prolificans]|uniref:Wax synthase domain-containing protein n=1 Tax=Lomentospora prolificans TaxID=41688 RepID=A0A2N3NDS0_9PEZI|nr:hypothetical protein jhhlp_002315 [Lomentospora prolificans]
MSLPVANLGRAIQTARSASFRAAVTKGTAQPLILPYCLLGTFFIPALYLAIPHTDRPWLYRARFAVAALIVSFNIQLIIRTSGSNPAIAYGSGLYAYWGIMNCLAMLVWTRPQFDAARIVKVKAGSMPMKESEKPNQDQEPGPQKKGHTKPQSNRAGQEISQKPLPNASVVQAEKGYTYYWEPFPKHATFRHRFNWATDLMTTFRGEGWSWAIPTVPHPPRPTFQEQYERVRLEDIPKTTQAGCTRYDTAKAYLYGRLKSSALSYLLLDAMSTYMTMDPFFIIGPNTLPLPPLLQSIPNSLLDVGRSLLFLLSVYQVVLLVLSYLDILQYFVGGYFYPIRREVWQHSSIFGSPWTILDRGLAGFWGGWWHQTFRVPFTAPVSWMVTEGYLPPRSETTKLLGVISAFLNSGLLHACGSYTTVPPTKLYRAPLFFSLSALGIFVQQVICRQLTPLSVNFPKSVRRCGNGVFVAWWLWATCWPLAYDFGTAGLWLFEPVPVSIFKGLGLGADGESWWRWDDYMVKWYWGKRWWETGLALGA